MPISSERVRNYAGDMPRIAPDYLREWAEERTWTENALLFKCDRLTDPMTEIRSKAARCRCTACGESFWTDWIRGGMCRYGGDGGIRLWEEGKPKEVTDWQSCRCPECGAVLTQSNILSDTDDEDNDGYDDYDDDDDDYSAFGERSRDYDEEFDEFDEFLEEEEKRERDEAKNRSKNK